MWPKILCWIALAANVAAVLVNLGIDRTVLAHGTDVAVASRLLVVAALSGLFLTGPLLALRTLLRASPIANR